MTRDAAAYGRDFKVFHAFARQSAPDMLVLCPGSVGETAGSGGVACTCMRTACAADPEALPCWRSIPTTQPLGR